MPEARGFRILALDGGGIWSLLQAMALERAFGPVPGRQILAGFDLVTGTSGGSIVLAGLMLDWTPARILECFLQPEWRGRIFQRKAGWMGWLAQHVQLLPRYDAAAKLAGLRAVMGRQGDTSMAALAAGADWPRGPAGEAVRCQIVAFDYDRQRATFLRSYDVAPLHRAADGWLTLAEAVNASSMAPVQFFDAPAVAGAGRFWDGAMGGYNNPLLAGLVDALALGQRAGAMQVLSLGTGSVKRLPSDLADETMPLALVEDRARPGVRTDVTRVAKAILEDPPDAATFIAQVMISPEPAALGPVVRLSPLLMPVKGTDGWHLPAGFSVPEFEALLALGLDALAPEEVERIAHLGRAWIAGHCPNQPIRQRLGMTPDPGDATFAEGLERWRALTAT